MTTDTEIKSSPMMNQWQACKNASKDAILFFRMGDFYEAFYDDAAILAKELDLTLTSRQGIPMSGVPFHASDQYLDKMVSKGYRVAIAEQVEDPKKAKGLVKREVVRIITPGTLINSSLLTDNANNFIVALTRVGDILGLAVLDLTTADFKAAEFTDEQHLCNELYCLRPAEIVMSKRFREKHIKLLTTLQQAMPFLITESEEWHFDHQTASSVLTEHFKVRHLDGFGLRGMVAAINAGGALLFYLKETLSHSIDHIRSVQVYSTSDFMVLDSTTQRNLELTESLQGGRKNTLLETLDVTHTPMGGRLLRQWIKQPLLSSEEIAHRQDAVEALVSNHDAITALQSALASVKDLERLMMRISTGFATPRDISALRFSLEAIPAIKIILEKITHASSLLAHDTHLLHDYSEVIDLIARAIVDQPPFRLSDGNVIREGYNQELDSLRALSSDSKSWIAQYQSQLREQTGIKTLKVGFNRMFGYYIEVSKGQADKMPDSFSRRQTLVNAERFITPDLKDYESKVLTAEDRIAAIENELFQELRQQVAKCYDAVVQTAHAIGRIDVFQSLAQTALKFNYSRPIVDDSSVLQIVEGRHPVIEGARIRQKFVPNDTLLDNHLNRTLIITGPNMAGKSTYIRQVALITILAQMGSFVPAKSAQIGIVDKVFTRIGASDDLTRGQSTFMVEMAETANILNNATPRSLVILDEIGRGTSTYDGISIAWAVAEYLLTNQERMSKTLFATHYWELTKLEEKIPGAVNYHVAVQESGDNIIFLHKIVRGGTDRSYGIHVAQLAGLPTPVIARAREILTHLEENANQKSVFEPTKPRRPAVVKTKIEVQDLQLTLFE